ncbi:MULTISPECIES: ABC transporter substrate-binding protein [Thermaerobacter]|uniref:ABC transporter substrate-binding protein n=1 Tax=Thermaerobacter composti TaxID=554949 RepID=A0ABZ0QRB6_9FIRM|nr:MULTISPECIES: ABC transporter substrate-binding protein [Thermaerobacter]PZN08268.1 MAG: ABC transporter substrate-binding protein [Bacillota bacterium]QBS37693.1 ABC transporter substrate-binding protein [Thermaerobacter sp. FW80]WPD19834.1 ABC transporter substrate-binding protein [Thermaerobacter composti]
MVSGWRRRLGMAAMVVAVAILATACGAPPQSAGEGGAGGGDGGQPADTLVWGRGGDSVSLDPANVTDGESLKVTHQIFDTLVEFKEGSTEVEPWLAADWEVSDDGKVWTFQLRQGVTFHDGTPFNAEAVVFNFERWMNTDNPHRHEGENFEYYAYMFGGFDEQSIIAKVEAVDEYTVRFTLREPLASFLQNLAMPCFAIASPEAIKKYGADFGRHPVGTGPYRFVEWIPDQQITLEAYDQWWGEPKPKVRRIVYRAIKDNSARLAELMAGTIDVMEDPNPADLATVDTSQFEILYREANNVGYLALNNDKEPFDDVRVRRAIAHAINKQEIVEAFWGELGQVAKNPLPPAMWGYNDAIQDYAYDPEKAKQLLAEAGYPEGFETELWTMPVPRPYMPEPQKIAEAIQQDLAAVGIRAEIVTHEWDVYLEKTGNGEHPMALLGWIGDNGDPDNFLYVLLDKDNAKTPGAGNISFYRSEEVHRLLIRAQRTPEQSVREQLYKEAQEIIHRDVPMIPLAHARSPIIVRKGVEGLVPSPLGSEKLHKVSVTR